MKLKKVAFIILILIVLGGAVSYTFLVSNPSSTDILQEKTNVNPQFKDIGLSLEDIPSKPIKKPLFSAPVSRTVRVIKTDNITQVYNLSVVNETHYCFNIKIDKTESLKQYPDADKGIYKFRRSDISYKDKQGLKEITKLNYSKAELIDFNTNRICSGLIIGIDSYGFNTTEILITDVTVGYLNSTAYIGGMINSTGTNKQLTQVAWSGSGTNVQVSGITAHS